MTGRRASIIEGVAIAAFVLWIAWPFIAPGGYVTDFDTIRYSGPNLLTTFRAYSEHRLPFWEPGIFGGTAFVANVQTAVFSPIKWLAWPLGAEAAMGWITTAHLFLLGFGMRHLARRTLALAAPAGFVAAAVMVGGGTTMVETVRFEQLAVVAWVPWLLVALDALARAPAGRWARPVAGAALTVTLIVLAGHPQQAYIGAVLALVWVVVRARDVGARVKPLVARLTAAGVLGLGMAAVQLALAVPLLRHLAVTPSAMAGEASLDRYGLSPARLVSAFLGDPSPPTGGSMTPTYETPAFVGAAAVVLAVIGAVACARRRTPTRRATGFGLVGLAVGGIVLALGPNAGFYRLAAAVVPGFGNGRVPTRWLFLTTFALALLAAVGTATLLRDGLHLRLPAISHPDGGGSPANGRRGAALAAVITFGVIVIAAVAPPWSDGHAAIGQRVGWIAAAGAVLAIGVVIASSPGARTKALAGVALAAVVAVELAVPASVSYARDLRSDQSFVDATGTEPLLAGLDGRALAWKRADVNANLTAGWRTLDGYDGGLWVTDSWAAAVREFSGGSFDPILHIGTQATLPLDADALARLGVRYVVLDGRAPENDSQIIIGDWPGPEAVDATGERFVNPSFRGEALVYPPAVAATAPPSSATPVTSTRPDTQTIDVTTRPGDAAGRLVVAEQALPGWSVTVDGRSTELVRIDGFSLGVDVPAGAHDVRFHYEPPGLVVGAAVSLLSILATAALALYGWRRQRSMTGAGVGA